LAREEEEARENREAQEERRNERIRQIRAPFEKELQRCLGDSQLKQLLDTLPPEYGDLRERIESERLKEKIAEDIRHMLGKEAHLDRGNRYRWRTMWKEERRTFYAVVLVGVKQGEEMHWSGCWITQPGYLTPIKK
jgi:hypothetical protein